MKRRRKIFSKRSKEKERKRKKIRVKKRIIPRNLKGKYTKKNRIK